jgi:NADH dehydrogenase [ubiquinone] 1 alpha subcomplex assembly factor 7
LRNHFIKKIKLQGPISVAEFMTDCLLSPKKGYYNLENTIGNKGDFITAPEISQIFGELIGLSFVDYWHQCKKPKSPIITDLGGGKGTMLDDCLRAISKVDKNLRKFIQPTFVESSNTFKKKQKKIIPDSHSFGEIDEIPDGFLMLYANEFFDALPIHQFIKINNKWHERLIDLDLNNNLEFIADNKPSLYEKILPKNLQNNEIIEFSPAAIQIVSSLTKRVLATGGIILIIDYALSDKDTFGSLQAVKDHKYIDPLCNPGNSDLSSKVNFSILIKVAEELNAKVYGPIKQNALLKNLGIELRCEQLIQNNPSKKKSIINDYNRLTANNGMGDIFEAIAITPQNLLKPAGF